MADEEPREESSAKTRKRRSAGGGLPRASWFNPKPNASDKQWLESNEDKHVELCLSLLDAIPDVGKCTIKYDKEGERWVAILFVRSDANEKDLDALSVRGATAFDALCLLAYFHVVKFEGAWVDDTPVDGSRWG